jgi:hypothetical protein
MDMFFGFQGQIGVLKEAAAAASFNFYLQR